MMNYFFVIISSFISMLIGYLRYKYTYWELQGVQQLKTHFLFGNLFKLKSVHVTELLHEVYQQFKGKAVIAGAYVFTKPIVVVLDLDVAKAILIKDFNKFTDRSEYRNEENDPLSAHLFNLYGEKWRAMRTKLSPTFTSGKMKFMFPTIVQVAKEFEEAFEKQLAADADGVIELHDIMARFTTDVIGTCVFGIECNSLKDPNVEFRRMGRLIFGRTYYSVRWRLFLSTYSNFLKRFGFKRASNSLYDFIMRVVNDTVTTREKNNIKRNDFINILIEMKNSKDLNGMPGLTIEQIAAQVFVFFIAGFETSSSNTSYGLFEMAKNPQIQDKLRAEIMTVLEKHNGELTYEAMMEMSYLDQVITETLRKYPALSSLTRFAGEDYQVPGTTITLEKSTKIHIPVKEIHYDPDIYESPHEFRPERFSAEQIQLRHPQAFLGFGDGPRNCIGLRFGRMQVRIGLITLLKSFRFSLAERTPNELEISKHSFVLIPDGGVWLKAERL